MHKHIGNLYAEETHLVSQQASLFLQLLLVNVDQALEHVSLKKLRAHLEVDNLEKLLNKSRGKYCKSELIPKPGDLSCTRHSRLVGKV